MARGKSTSKAVSNMIAIQMRSDQPVFQDTDDIMDRDIQIGRALNWYNALSTDAKERKWYWEYAKANKLFKGENLSRIKVADSKMFHRIGRFARMTMDGFPLDHDRFIQNKLDGLRLTLIDYLKPKKKVSKKTETTKKLSVQERMDEKAEELTGNLLNMIDEYIGDIKSIKKSDDGNHVNIESFLNVEEVKPLIAKRILSHIECHASEWDEVVDNISDKDLKEAYSYLTTSEHKRIQRMYKKVLDELSVRASQKRQRKTRKKKVKTPAQIVSKVKYQESCKETNVDSIQPEKIVGSARVILFNTKYREYQIIEAENEKIGLTIEGTTIKGIDKNKSVCKRIREKYVQDLLNITQVKGIRTIRNEYKGIRATENTPTGRLNGNTLIVRVMK